MTSIGLATTAAALGEGSVDLTVASSTGLLSREAFLAELSHDIREAVATGQSAALVLFDINAFAEINAAWGVSAGDGVLSAAGLRVAESAADRLARAGAASARAGHLDADHFAIVISGVRNWGSVRDSVAELVRVLAQPYSVEGRSIAVGVRAAVICIPEHARSLTSALGRGFRLLNNAARLNPEGVVLSEQGTLPGTSVVTLERDLATAIKSDQIFLTLQPKVDAKTMAVEGAEALVRWQHPDRGFLPPAMFIDIAEKSGLIFDLGLRVLRDACRASDVLGALGKSIPIAVNVSPHQLAHPDFLSRFLEVIDQEGVAPSLIAIEVTETAAMMGGEIIGARLRSLRRCGIGVAIDDFGTGFSNLASLSTLHADTLKIDRSLVAHHDDDRRSAALLGITVQLAHTFAMRTVAEGVETSTQLDRVRAVGCDSVQGYLTGKPVILSDFEAAYLRNAPASRG